MIYSKFQRFLTVIMVIVLLACFAGPEAGAQDKKTDVAAVITSIKGKANVLPHRSEEWKGAREGDFLYEGDKIKTAAGSNVSIAFLTGNEISINEKSVFTIVINEEGERGIKNAIEIEIGEIFSRVKPGTIKFEMRLPNAVASVRGTEFNGRVRKNGLTTITVYKGIVEVSNKFGKVLLEKATRTTVKANKAPMPPVKVDIGVKPPEWRKGMETKGALQFNVDSEEKIAGIPFEAVIKVYSLTGKFDSEFNGEISLISDSPWTDFSVDGKAWGVKKAKINGGKTKILVKNANKGVVLIGVSGAGLRAAVRKINFSLPPERTLLLRIEDEEGEKTLKLKFER